jgi:hypothetical protein
MNKQEVLEKIVFYLTKKKSEEFYTQQKGKFYINIEALDSVITRKRVSISDNNDFNSSIKNLFKEYNIKRINKKDLMFEIANILHTNSIARDKEISSIKLLPDKKRFIESEVSKVLNTLNNEMKEAGIDTKEYNEDIYLTEYETFVLKPIQDKVLSIPITIKQSYIDNYCSEAMLSFLVESHYNETKKNLTDKIKDESKRNEEVYVKLKETMLTVTKEEVFLPLDMWWNIKLKLDVLYYIPTKEQKVTSFYFITNKLRVNYNMKIDPYLYSTVNSLISSYYLEAVEEFRNYYYNVFGDYNYRQNFINTVKNNISWSIYRTLFINICITSNLFLFGEMLRTWTKEYRLFPTKNYNLEKKYHSFIDNDVTSQKIRSGLETKKHIDELLSSIYSFDKKEQLDDIFVEKHSNLFTSIFDNFKPVSE